MVLQNSSLVFKVRRNPPELVAPANPTPHESKLLSDIDDQKGLRYHIPLVQFHRYHPSMKGKDHVQVIRQALAKTLVFYYPLAGRLREGPNGKLMVDCTGQGVMFIEADADVTLEQFGIDLHPPFPCFGELLYNVPGSDGIINCPIVLVQRSYHHGILTDLLGDGIFTVDGEKWQHQSKVASYEISTKTVKDFSLQVFKSNAVKLARVVSEAAMSNKAIDFQELLMKSTLDSVFKIVLGVDFDTICGTHEEGTKFSNAFDEASAITLYRYVDIFWKIKRFLNMGRMKFIWGDDAEEFQPERWLDENGAFRQESSFKFTAFQAGPRMCLGKDFAYRQMKVFKVVLSYGYKFQLAVQNESVNYRTMLTLHIDGGLHLHASNRLEHFCF